MQTFLDQVATHLYKSYPDTISDLCVVFPNRRAGLFFNAALARQANKPFWAPELFSIEDFIVKLSGVELLDPIGQLFELYEVYKSVEKEKAESFDAFSKWGQILLTDFNEIDSSLVNAKDLFGNLKNIKELEHWTLGSLDLTSFQQKYLHFWNSIGNYYTLFTDRLTQHKQAYQGMAYRLVANNITEKLKAYRHNKIIFVGFNALSVAEEKIFKELVGIGKAEILWDVDSYYVDNNLQEAGRFFRKHKHNGIFDFSTEEKNQWIGNSLSTDSKQITVTGISGNIGQAKFAGQLVETFLKENPQTNLTQTAIILADENLLFPVLHSLPGELSSVNVTMGYPLKNTSLSSFFELVFQLHENAKRIDRKGLFYHHDVISLLSHPYAKTILDVDGVFVARKIINYLHQKNIVFCSLLTFEPVCNKLLPETQALLQLIFNTWKDTTDALNCLYLIVDILKLRFNEQWKLKHTNDTTTTNLELEHLFAFSKIVKRINTLLNTYPVITDVKVLHGLFTQLLRSTNLSFYGEPVSGLQVMGMLETRTLDFETVILLSANEGLLPAGKTQNSFIPFDVKRVFGLSTYSEKDSIFAYHFYRLLQRTKNVHVLYNTETNELGGGEKSRFLEQLLYELPVINKFCTIKEQLMEVKVEQVTLDLPIVINKTADILEVINKKAETGFSPSLLNTYRNCSLKFYFQLIGKLREQVEVEELIGADVLGNAIHGTLEELYKPFVGKKLSESDIVRMKQQAEEGLQFQFQKEYTTDDLKYGKNLLTFKVANRFIQNFLAKEIELLKDLESKNVNLLIDQLEYNLERNITIGTKSVKAIGKVDRIDSINALTRIIDYKTGVVDDKELKVKDWELLKHDVSMNKSFQLLMYSWLYNAHTTNIIKSGIISFRQLSSGLKTVKMNEDDTVSSSYLNEFETVLKTVLEELFDSVVPFTKTSDKAACLYCDFTTICSR